MTIFDWGALVALAYFGSAAPGQIRRFYQAGLPERRRLRSQRRSLANWWLTLALTSASSIVWHCIPAATIYGIGLIFA